VKLTRRELKELYPNADPAFIDANSDPAPSYSIPTDIVERIVDDDSDGKVQKKARDTRRYLIRYEVVRKRLLDRENCATKTWTDALRVAGIIPDDTYEQADIEIKQRKAVKGEAETVTISVFQLSE
jgi:hypothetical protein